MSIKIIGAGFPRTGTNTLKESLESLGYMKTYHMKELIVHPENLRHWLMLRDTGTTNWEELYNGYEATVDFPCYPWYKEHMKQYPEAKVILTIRPFEKWHDSVYSTIWQAQNPTEAARAEMEAKMRAEPRLGAVIKCVQLAKEMMMEKQFHGKFLDKAYAEKIFYQHTEDVKAYVPADKLLVFDVSEGWGPLCRFLEVPEPTHPLPHTNKKENFKEMLQELMQGHLV